ncbi:MAG: hypothetical protein ACPHUD_10130, partial [Porticoccaceae bacterium]
MSTVIADNLTGKTSAGDVTITDGSVTMQLQQGVAKMLGGLNQNSSTVLGVTAGSGITESLNVTSYTDVSAGIYNITFTNDFVNVDKLVFGSAQNTNNVSCPDVNVSSVSQTRMRTTDADSNG